MLIAVLTNQTSPYQVELFNAVARAGQCQLKVVYLHSHHPSRSWGARPIEHEHLVLDEQQSRLADAASIVDGAALAVFGYYKHPFAYQLLRRRAASGKPWCFWGERPGATRMAWAGAWYRRWKLRDLHRSNAAIWGISEFALAGYRNEFGADRLYLNLPYFSDLERFAQARSGNQRATSETVFLFSGSLIPRKGVDLLAGSFVRLAEEFPHIRLEIVGEGPLRGSLEATLSKCGDKVRFHGFQDWHALPKHYANADVLCVPSRYDGWALVVPEGLAAGLPVLSTDRTGAALEFIRNGENGWMARAGDVQSWVSVMREAATTGKEKLAAMSVQAQRSVANHQLSNGVERFFSACERTLGERNTVFA